MMPDGTPWGPTFTITRAAIDMKAGLVRLTVQAFVGGNQAMEAWPVSISRNAAELVIADLTRVAQDDSREHTRVMALDARRLLVELLAGTPQT